MKAPFARQYGDLSEWHWWFRGRREILTSVLRRQIAASPQLRGRPLTAASIGSGPPRTFRWLLEPLPQGSRIIGVDADPAGVLRLEPSEGPATPLVIGSIGAIPLADASCDVLFLLDVLEHIEDERAGLQEILRVLRPGGLFLLTVPAGPELWGAHDLIAEHFRRYTRASLAKVLASGGLPADRITYFNTLLYPPVAAVRLARRLTNPSPRPQSDFHGSRPGFLNMTLRRLFGAERHLLKRADLPFGVSLLAIHTRSPGG